MIHLYPVGEFVNDNIIYDLLRGEDESPVEVQVTKAAAASPAGLLFSNRDTVVGDIHYGCVVGDFLGEHCTCDFTVVVTFRGWEGWTLWEWRCGLCMFKNPGFLFSEQAFDGRDGSTFWCTHFDLTVGSDLDGQGLAGTVYYFVREGKFLHGMSPRLVIIIVGDRGIFNWGRGKIENTPSPIENTLSLMI